MTEVPDTPEADGNVSHSKRFSREQWLANRAPVAQGVFRRVDEHHTIDQSCAEFHYVIRHVLDASSDSEAVKRMVDGMAMIAEALEATRAGFIEAVETMPSRPILLNPPGDDQ